jgi:hypothetical protein
MDDNIYNSQSVDEPREKRSFLNKFTIIPDSDDINGQSKFKNGLTLIEQKTTSSN